MKIAFCKHCGKDKAFYESKAGRCQDCIKELQNKKYKDDPLPQILRVRKQYDKVRKKIKVEN
jgi:uncharacterized membrane protein YvbJ